ncbi:hypothetical protein GF318_05185 [Candidatus Micrarchaeota archaeon]|nr:hypothetical protein [Candidatus Micrarchaeota archaeon]
MRKAYVLLAILVLSSVVFPTTEVTVDDCSITVDVKVGFAGDGASDEFIKKFEDGVKKIWQGKDFTYGDCECPVEIKLETKKFVTCYQAGKDYHCFDVQETDGFYYSYVRHTLYSDRSFWRDGKMRAARGNVSTSNTGNILAHEFGHLMGLKDEYYYVYYYFYVNEDGTVASGPHAVKTSEWNGKKDDIQDNAPEGAKVVLARKKDGTNHYVKYQDGVPTDSIMLNIDGTPKAYQHHIDAIVGGAGIECPDECCCGNGRVELGKGEECDYKASPEGCMEGEKCTNDCVCEIEELPAICGDGQIDGEEECDYAATPDGCPPEHTCSPECACFFDPPTFEEDMDIISPAEGAVLTFPEPVELSFGDPSRIVYINYWIGEALVYQSEDPGYMYMLEPEMIGEGEHVLTVQAFNMEMADTNRSVSFTVEMPE